MPDKVSLKRRGFMGFAGAAAAALTCCCGRALGQTAQDPGAIPGDPVSPKNRMLGLGADLLQSDGPIDAINMYLNGFHFYADDMGRQVEAHHYCTHVNEDFFQCVIYDGNKAGARLIGIEYIVSERIFKTLPEDEKRLWHSHAYETTSGELVMPGVPEAAEHAAIASLVSTYGKTWHTWQVDRDAHLPLGIPQLMMGFTKDGQLDGEMLNRRDEALGIDTAETREARADLVVPAVVPGANSWQSGKAPQLTLADLAFKNGRG